MQNNALNINQIIEIIDERVYNESKFIKFLSFISAYHEILENLLKAYFKSKHICSLVTLKILNLLVLKYQFIRQHPFLIAKPFGLIVDPSNGCNLHCPGCVHSKNNKNKFIWTPGNLTKETYIKFIENYGPTATDIFFYNWGEPLLNKLTPIFIKIAKKYLLRTAISSNFSLDFNHEELVTSGIDYITIALDGATKTSYSKYRKGGNFELVLENIKKIVEIKNKLKTNKPYLQWRFLVFEHNMHEIDLAKKLAYDLKVDELKIETPFPVNWDDPSINIAKDIKPEQIFINTQINSDINTKYRYDYWSEMSEIENKSVYNDWYESFQDIEKYDNFENYQDMKPTNSTCQWLYKNIVMDAKGNILTCCMAPTPERDLVFSNITYSTSLPFKNVFNSKKFRLARKFYSDIYSFSEDIKELDLNGLPYCIKCGGMNNTLTITNQILKYYLEDISLFSMLSDNSRKILTEWDWNPPQFDKADNQKLRPLILIEIGPSKVTAGKDFNTQPNGDSAIWVKVANATENTVIFWDDNHLQTTFKNSNLLTAVVPKSLYSTPGKHKIFLFDSGTGRKSNAGLLTVNEKTNDYDPRKEYSGSRNDDL